MTTTHDPLVQVGRKPCGCIVAVDWDSRSSETYRERGYTVEQMPSSEATRLLYNTNCLHGTVFQQVSRETQHGKFTAKVTNNGAVVHVEHVWICRLSPDVAYLDVQTKEKYVGGEQVGEVSIGGISESRISVLFIANNDLNGPTTTVEVSPETDADRAFLGRSILLPCHGRHVAGFYLVPDLHGRDEAKSPVEMLWTAEGGQS